MAPPRWLHTEEDAEKTAVDALVAANKKEWGLLSVPDSLRRLRSLMAMTAQATYLTSVKPAKGPLGVPEYATYGVYENQERLEIASIVSRTPLLLVPKDLEIKLGDVWTVNGKAPVAYLPDGNVSLPPLVVAGLVVFGISAFSIAMVKIAGTGEQVVDRELKRREDTRQMLFSQGKALELIGNHVKREDSQKKIIPYSQEEKEVLSSLLNTQKKVAERREEPLPSPFQGATDTLSNAGNAIKEGATDALETVVPLAALGFAAVKFL